MLFQLFIFVVLLLLVNRGNNSNYSDKLKEKNRKTFIFVAMVLLTVQSGFRNLAVGSDPFQYYNHFEMAITSSWTSLIDSFIGFIHGGEGKDPGYALLQKTFGTFFPSYRLFLIMVAVFFFYALGKTFKEYTSSNMEVLISIALYQCLYYTFFSITGIRQTIASGILLFALPYVFERKLWKFLLLLVLAATQHKSALLFAPFYLLPLVKDSRKFILLAFVLFAPMWIFGDQIAKYLVMGSIFEQYASYLEQNEIAGAYTFALYMIILGVLMFGNYKQIVNADGRNNVFVCAVSIAIMLTPLTMIDPSNMRIVQYYSVFGLLVLPKCLISIQFRYNMDLSMIVFLFLAAYTLYRMEPYAFFWQDMELGINYGGGIINDNSIRY